ncbi:caspase-1 isoform X1 [Oreochromis niloticus]|uniref:caspase-1 isoform X1 n=1 Tax=Oreochromis niloticus TaxID=8128 RepID=UPI000393F02A|nr:caspase-1 isoform X1 [Oreochromis niloticus]XP_025761682.1 caspase-1 isoform X1 [Oreochromis niloticus]
MIVDGHRREERRMKEVGCQWESPVEDRKEVGCQWESPVEDRKEVGCQSEAVQVDVLNQQLSWRHSGLPDTSKPPADCTAEEMLMAVRSQFIDRVSEAVLSSLLDKLLERRIVIDDEIDLGRANGRVNNARRVIDMVRRKGSQACSTLIAALCKADPFLSKELQLK